MTPILFSHNQRFSKYIKIYNGFQKSECMCIFYICLIKRHTATHLQTQLVQ